MKRRMILIIGFGLFFGIQNVIGQVSGDAGSRVTNPLPDYVYRNEKRRQEQNKIHGRDNNGMILRPKEATRSNPPLTVEQKERLETSSAEARAETERKNKLLRAPAEYYAKYESFLKNKKTRLARLFIDKDCDKGKTVAIRELERCADVVQVKGGGSYYSFRSKNNDGYLNDWWDIHFINDKFVVGNGTVQGLISEIGDVDLDNINLKSKELDFLDDYKPKRSVAEIKKQNIVLEKGLSFNGFNYSNSAPANINSTYVLRSIAYPLKENARYSFLDARVDMTLVFKVVGHEKDGSIVILWKELKTDLPLRKLE